MWFDTRIIRLADALLHCSNLYKALGIEPKEPNALIEMTVRYSGLRGRTLTGASPRRVSAVTLNSHEDAVNVPPIRFRLGAIETELVDLVKQLCEPLFVIFDFAAVPDNVYQQIVTDFVQGRTR